ncbi:MAG TPA: hypothetical protein VFL29_04540 [Candidatus Dormibacteraeota bacterium]|nr:hypothetical protein [Candidatus Dormibacteraeota bacterium]
MAVTQSQPLLATALRQLRRLVRVLAGPRRLLEPIVLVDDLGVVRPGSDGATAQRSMCPQDAHLETQ